MAPIPFAVVAGVGPGTGAAVARRFSKAYPIALLARSPESYEPLVKEINNAGGQAIGISADVSNEESIKSAFAQIKKEYQGAGCAAAIFNASGRFVRKPLLEMSGRLQHELGSQCQRRSYLLASGSAVARSDCFFF
jgi:NAD(P)-dependent dehydrogenase (short-subunit alcohol dehydrogenase family)